MKIRILFLIFVGLLLVSCASKAEVKGVESKTLMNGQTVYYALTDCGKREVSQTVYADLVYKLNHLAVGKTLMCDMERGPGGVYDLAVCFQDVIAVSEAGAGQ